MTATASGNRILLTARKTAAALAISERKLWGLTADGSIPAVRIGRLVRYSAADLRQWIDQQRTAGPRT
jgi:excisionase family DNA binding protein